MIILPTTGSSCFYSFDNEYRVGIWIPRYRSQNFHLYKVEQSSIKVGDWYIENGIDLKQCLSLQEEIDIKNATLEGEEFVAKVIATTNPELELKTISKEEVANFLAKIN